MTISVIIATYNREPLLDECLQKLQAQSFVPGDEIIVVDNGSTDGTAGVLARHQRRSAVRFTIVQEPRPGKSNALAAAIAIATGDVLAFTDDDVNVGSGWLDALRTAFAAGTADLIGGPVMPRWERPAPAWLKCNAEAYGRLASPLALLNYGPSVADLGDRTLLGANLAVRRTVLDQVGGFASHLGKLRGTLLSGEDHEFCRRVQASGFRAAYCPAAIVRHWVPAKRMRVGYFLDWFFWSGITNAALDHENAPPRRALAGVPLYLIKRFGCAVASGLVAGLRGDRAAAMDRAVDVAYAAGYAARCWGFAPAAGRSHVPSGATAA